MKERGITFKDVIDAYTDEKLPELVEKAPLADAVLGMVVKHHPAPQDAIKYRIPQIWKGDLESDVGKALLAGEDDGPTIMMVVNMVLDPAAGPNTMFTTIIIVGPSSSPASNALPTSDSNHLSKFVEFCI